MIDLPPDLVELGKTLKQDFVMHIHGTVSIMSYRIVDAAGKVVGHKSVHTVNKTGKATVVYAIGDERFETTEAFLKAHQQTLRDAEWDASAPKEKTT